MASNKADSNYVMVFRMPFKMLHKMDKCIAAENRRRVDMDINRSSYMRSLLAKELNHAS